MQEYLNDVLVTLTVLEQDPNREELQNVSSMNNYQPTATVQHSKSKSMP